MKENKIILVTLAPKSHRTSEENLGIEYLKSSLVEKGYIVELIDAWLNNLDVDTVYAKIIKQIDNVLFVGISSYMSNTAPTLDLIKKLKTKDKNIKIVCGGFGPTFYPKDFLLGGSDFIIRGEGEEAIVDLANSLLNKQNPTTIENIGYKNGDLIILNKIRTLNDDLDKLPFPSRDDIDVVLSKKSYVNMITARGCTGNCEFCSVISFFRLSSGKLWRTRSIKNIVDEIELLYKKGIKHIKMVDDSFIDGSRDEKWCIEFADEIERRNIKVKLRGQIRADKVTDEVLKNLKRAGFFSFACGIENGSQTALSRMNKKATKEDNEKALKLFKKYNYIVQMGYILFDKYTTFEELVENYKFMTKYKFTITKGIFSEMYSTEGTALNEKLKKENNIEESNFILNNNKYTINDDIVRKIYNALKLWHKSHSKIYDMTIDPLTAPKAVSSVALNSFYKYAMILKNKDLEIYQNILMLFEKDYNFDISKYISQKIKETNDEYKNIEIQVKKIYEKNNLVYNAEINPFI